MFVLVQIRGQVQAQQQPTGIRLSMLVLQGHREAPGAQKPTWCIWHSHKLSDGEENAEVLRQRQVKIMHIMAYVTYNAKFQYAVLIYNTQNTLHWNMWTCQYKSQ